MNDTLPWEALLAASYGRLGLTPECFWSMTPAEWLSLTVRQPVPPTRQDVEKLAAEFPD